MAYIVEIDELKKTYKNTVALSSINLKVKKGKVLGVLGPNGSGKTTLIKILNGLLTPTKGQVLIDGNKIGPSTKAITSYLPDRNFLYDWMDIQDSMDFYKDFYEDFNEDKFNDLINFMNLRKDMKVKSLSKGMHEKLNLSLVLSREAKLYILDEPIAGVDPIARDQILNAIIDNYREDSAMIITTHLVREMENLLDEVAFLSQGRILLHGDTEVLREERQMQIEDLYKEIFRMEG